MFWHVLTQAVSLPCFCCCCCCCCCWRRVCEVHLAESCDFTPTSPAPNMTLPTVLQTTLASKIFKTCPKYWSTAYVLHFINFHYQTEADIRPFTLLGPFSDSQTVFCLRTSMSLLVSLFHFAKFRLELRTYSLYGCLLGEFREGSQRRATFND